MEQKDIDIIEEKLAVYGLPVSCVAELIDAANRMIEIEISFLVEGSGDNHPKGICSAAKKVFNKQRIYSIKKDRIRNRSDYSK